MNTESVNTEPLLMGKYSVRFLPDSATIFLSTDQYITLLSV